MESPRELGRARIRSTERLGTVTTYGTPRCSHTGGNMFCSRYAGPYFIRIRSRSLSALCATASRCLNVYCQSVLTSYWHRRGRCLSFYTPGGPYRAHGEDEGNGQGGPHNLGVRAWLGQRYALCASILFPVWYVVQIHSFPSSAEFFFGNSNPY